jgi:hypothetical protein
VSEKRLLGWEPAEQHDHEYDEDGLLVRTVVTREAEWDDLERDKMLALAQFEAEVCACGMHYTIADADPSLELTLRVCPVCAGMAQQMRVLQARDEATAKARGDKAPPGVRRPEDGRHIGLRPKPPGQPGKDNTTR